MEVTSTSETVKKTEVVESEEWKYKSYQSLVKWCDINSLVIDTTFIFHQIYTDFTADNKTSFLTSLRRRDAVETSKRRYFAVLPRGVNVVGLYVRSTITIMMLMIGGLLSIIRMTYWYSVDMIYVLTWNAKKCGIHKLDKLDESSKPDFAGWFNFVSCVVYVLSVLFVCSSQKHTYIILTPLNPTFIW